MDGIRLKKKHGQHFLREMWVTEAMVGAVSLTQQSSVVEIGCGDGFLTNIILQHSLARLIVFEIDVEWAEYVRGRFANDKRLMMVNKDFLDVDLSFLTEYKPLTLLANLPYNVTFPILYKLQEYRELFTEGVIMVQEEVAQKITKTRGRNYGFISLYFQHYFTWRLLEKIPPSAFYPPPKVFSRLLYFRPRFDAPPVIREDEFWQFIKHCFKQPRRTLLNNLKHSRYDVSLIDEYYLSLRAQQLLINDFLIIWQSFVDYDLR